MTFYFSRVIFPDVFSFSAASGDGSRLVLCLLLFRTTMGEAVEGAGEVWAWIIPIRIPKVILDKTKTCAKGKGFNIVEKPSKEITHVLTEYATITEVEAHLKSKHPSADHSRILDGTVPVLNVKWLPDSLSKKKLQPFDSYLVRVGRVKKANKDVQKNVFDVEEFNKNECNRLAPLDNPNETLAKKLQDLSEYCALVEGGVQGEARAVAFRTAAGGLRCLPFKVQTHKQVKNVKGIGDRAIKIIEDLTLRGHSEELDRKLNSDEFVTLKRLKGIFGVGSSLARKFYSKGCKSAGCFIKRPFELAVANDDRIKFGATFYDELNEPVPIEIVDVVRQFSLEQLSIVEQTLRSSGQRSSQNSLGESGVVLELVGGFRRGKKSGHDVDFLLGHKDGLEAELLQPFVDKLKALNLLAFGRIENAGYSQFPPAKKRKVLESSQRGTTMDKYEKCLCIMKVPKPGVTWEELIASETEPLPSDWESLAKMGKDSSRKWKAVRVDYVVVSQQEWWYAVNGWTGNTQFMRMLRMRARKFEYFLNNHGLWKENGDESLPAASEEDIFRHLQLEYREPGHRNF